ncbi:MAG: ATP-binding protein [Mariprofundaceae bacterium]|nr:ATP-binding protein [Mariprofundaceae bacterium]
MQRKLIRSWKQMGLLDNRTETTKTQLLQIAVRLVLSILFLVYIMAHAPLFVAHQTFCLISVSVYIAFNLVCIAWVRYAPYAVPRMLLAPVFDVSLTGMGMWLDGGHTSPVYLVLYVIIVGNAFRFGNVMLLYSQALSFITMIGICLITVYNLNMDLDWHYLTIQLLALIFIPGYAYLLEKRVEKAIYARRRAERESADLLAGSPIPAFTFEAGKDGDLHISYANPAIASISVYTPRAITGRYVDAIAIAEDGEEIRRCCRLALEGDDGSILHYFHIRGKNEEGEQRNLMCQATSIRWQGRQTGLCLMTDVTETEKLHDQLESAHRAGYVNSMIAGLTHDFRNILTHIIGNAEVLQMETSDPSFQDKLGVMIEAGERGSEMITNLLKMSQKKDVAQQIFNLDTVLPGIINLARVKLPMNISLQHSIQPNLPALCGNPAQIDQVVLNLIENSAQAIGDAGCIVISVEAVDHALAAHGLPAICITVHDNGCGIAENDLENIFKPFWTLHEHEGGSGLGMAMVKRIVAGHRGKVEIQSEVGKGTSVKVYLPPAGAQTPELLSSMSAPESLPVKLKQIKPWTVLLVDDDAEVLHVHGNLLKRMSQTLLKAENGKTALAQYQTHRNEINMIVTDYRMPVMDGLEMAKAIREIDAAIPILMITGYGEDVHLRECVKHHITIMNKPVSFQKLATHIGALQLR